VSVGGAVNVGKLVVYRVLEAHSRVMSTDRQIDPSFAKLRGELFGAHLGAIDLARESPATVQGVVIEIGTEESVLLVFGLGDGTASVYSSSGGAFMGGRDHPRINSAARALVDEARGLVGVVPRAVDAPLPRPGRVRISILSRDGLRAGEDDERSLMVGAGVLYPLFLRGNDIVRGYRALEPPTARERQPHSDEAAYVMCLLTALARGHQTSVRLFENAPLPDPAALTHDLRDLEWFTSLRLDLERLSAGGIVRFFCRRARFSELPRDQTTSSLRIPLQSFGGAPRWVFDFRVTQRECDGGFGVEVGLIRN
jgi:hypothetical protein